MQKQACLEYKYFEDKDSCDKMERVCKEIEIHFWEEYQNLLEGTEGEYQRMYREQKKWYVENEG